MIMYDDRHHFLPDNVLRELICRETVLTALERERRRLQTNISDLADFICNHAPKLFASLVWNESMTSIDDFYRCKIDDTKLPLELKIIEQDGETWINVFEYKFGQLNVIEDHPFHEPGWSDIFIGNFRDNAQWFFQSPVFYGHQFRYHFHDRARMPFISETHVSQRESHFSVVEQWQVHRNHLQLGQFTGLHHLPDEHPSVAIKELKTMGVDVGTFKAIAEKEARALERIRELDHPHLIKAIAYYTKRDRHYVMFPWAKLGNLRDFWKKDPAKLSGGYLQWAFRQLSGLAEAIGKLHHSDTDESWRHGDLKPENILCFEHDSKDHDPCILVIADVGLTQVHEKMTEMRKEATRTNQGTVMYEPPEAELQPTEPRSRRYDIWSMGCIYLEFVIWLLYGAKGLNQFRSDLCAAGGTTRFYVVEEIQNSHMKTARLNNVAQKWIDWIKKDTRCPENTAVRRLIELVVSKLLVAGLSRANSFPRRDSVLHEGDSSEYPDLDGLRRPSIVRTSTTSTHVDGFETPDHKIRATANEMDEEIKKIIHNTCSSTRSPIDWMVWSEAKHEGPRRYGDHLDPYDIDATMRDDPNPEVR